MSGPALEVRVLGPLEVLVDGRPVRAGTPKQRLVLALLAARANQAVPVARLIDVLWDRAPTAARKSVQAYVSGIRRLIGDRISFGDGGYTCRIGPAESDLERFEQLTAAGRRALRAADRETAAQSFDGALQLWRGRAFADFSELDWFAAESDRLQGRFLAAYEDWAELEIELGRAAALLDSLDDLALRHLDRERLSACRMTALALCGRTSAALAHYDRLRQLLAREYGIEPSPVLAELYRALLLGGPGSAKSGMAVAVNGQGTRTATNRPVGLAPRPRPDAEAGTATAAGTDAPVGAAEALRRPGAHQLPRRLADFTGRAVELDLILAGGTDVTVIAGYCGTGKTALAVQAGHLLRDSYPDGELFVRLRRPDGRPAAPDEAVRAALRGTGLADLLPPDGSPLPVWRSWLSERRMVVVADDAPDAASVNALLPGSASCRVLVTAHGSLGGLHCVQRIRLDEFGRDEAFTLLGRILGPARVRGARAAVQQLFDLLGSAPRTVRLLGEKLASLPHLTIADFAARAEAMVDPCDALAVGGRSPRADCGHWLGDLPALHRAALNRLAALPGAEFGYDEAISALTGLAAPPDQLIDALLEENILSAPSCEVSLHAALFEIPRTVRLACPVPV